MATTKPATKTTTTKKPAAPKKAATPKAEKKVTEKKPAAKKASSKKTAVSPFERYKMIEVAAYYIAEKDGFVGYAADYWITAEKEIDKKLSKK